MYLRHLNTVICVGIIASCLYISWSVPNGPESKRLLQICFLITFLSAAAWLIYDHSYSQFTKNMSTVKGDIRRTEMQLNDRRSEAELFLKVSELIETFSDTREVEAVLRGTTSIIKEILEVDVTVLQVYGDEADGFFMRAESGANDVTFSDNVVDDVLGKGMSRLINSLESYPRYSEMAENGYTSMLVAPLGPREQPIGLLGVLSTSGRHFTDKELRILTTFSKQASLIIENARMFKRTQDMAIRDGLTTLFNHRHFQERLGKEIAFANDNKTRLSLIMGDIDNFKKYNDMYGHPMGDKVLRTVGGILLDNTRGSDIVARYGGEEFVVILPGTGIEGALRVAENVRGKIASYSFSDDNPLGGDHLTISLGAACFPDDADDAGDLIQKADSAMYEAKRTGKNRVVNWQNMPG